MITATEARKLTDEILEPVSGSVEFKAIMARIERDIREAISDGLEKIEIIGHVSQVDSEPIYSASIGTETDKWDDDADTGTSVFDITIRGTNEAAVNQLRDAIAKMIGGMAAQFDPDLDSDGNTDYGRALNKFIDKWNLMTNSI